MAHTDMVNEALATLKAAKRRGVPWHEVAKAVMLIEGASPQSPEGRPWIDVAVHLSGYDAPLLRRYISAHKFIEEAARNNEKISSAKEWSFSLLELLKRIYDADAREAENIVFNNKGGIKQRELSSRLKAIRKTSFGKAASPIAEGKIAAREFSDLCLKILRSGGLEELYKNSKSENLSIIRWRVPHRWVSPDFAVVHADERQVDAVDCYLGLNANRQDAIRRRIRDIKWESNFFDRFWVVVPYESGAGWLFSRFMREVKEIEKLRKIGLVEISIEEKIIKNVDLIGRKYFEPNENKEDWTDYEIGWLR